MTFSEIKQLIDIIDKSVLHEFELKNSSIYLRMSKNKSTQELHVHNVKEEAKNNFSEIVEEIKAVEVVEKEGAFVKSPIVGTFYESSSPNKPPFVKLGDKVKKGQVLCIIEAMKVMNEIVSEYDGVIDQIFVKNEDMVEYDENLFKIV